MAANPAAPEVFDIFPTPVMRVPGALDAALVAALAEHFSAQAHTENNASQQLSHTAMLQPGDSPLLVLAAQALTPRLAAFGALLFGEALGWAIKEMWVNVLDEGGRQAMHTHANSFISGVVYLTPTHEDARTVFMKSPGGQGFVFRNDHAGTVATPYSADKWISPQPQPGDLVLFPSYVLHAVPTNPGPRRITLAMNAIPTHLDSWGYRIGFSG
jgi:uncharacterized protein (TIGR02466 family)